MIKYASLLLLASFTTVSGQTTTDTQPSVDPATPTAISDKEATAPASKATPAATTMTTQKVKTDESAEISFTSKDLQRGRTTPKVKTDESAEISFTSKDLERERQRDLGLGLGIGLGGSALIAGIVASVTLCLKNQQARVQQHQKIVDLSLDVASQSKLELVNANLDTARTKINQLAPEAYPEKPKVDEKKE